MKKVFIDGSVGTTGLRIVERLQNRSEIELISLSEEVRKDENARKEAINSADIVFLCLPDDASRESVSFVENDKTVIIDASTAHRTLPDWAYGFAELDDTFRNKIKSSKRIAVPGCYASGFDSLVYPLIKNGIIAKSTNLTCFAVSGYSGAGKKVIADYESKDRNVLYDSPRQYALTQTHKHLKEMKAISNLDSEPIFCPLIADYYSGMEVTVPLFKNQLLNGATIEDIKNVYKNLYISKLVKYVENDENGFLASNALSGRDILEVSVYGNEDRIILVSRFDNLGKGASGAAVQCMNISLGIDETTGLTL